MERKHVEIVAATERDPIKAAALLIFTKATRLAMDGAALADIERQCRADEPWMMRELGYMAKTIRSSWEFLDVIFSIRSVSRACAQQITRTRFTPIDGDLFGSYAMQSQRVTDMSAATWHNPIRDGNKPEFSEELAQEYDMYMQEALDNYKLAIEQVEVPFGSEIDVLPAMALEDARGLLPVNLHCNLVAKYNLRILADLVQARQSYRAQGEFNIVAAEMRSALIEMWPWAELFLKPKDELAKLAMEDLRTALRGAADHIPPAALHDIRIKVAKVDDLLQGGK